MAIEPCRHPDCTSTYAGEHTWHVTPMRTITLTGRANAKAHAYHEEVNRLMRRGTLLATSGTEIAYRCDGAHDSNEWTACLVTRAEARLYW